MRFDRCLSGKRIFIFSRGVSRYIPNRKREVGINEHRVCYFYLFIFFEKMCNGVFPTQRCHLKDIKLNIFGADNIPYDL